MLDALIIGAVSNIALNFILIPRYEVWGASVATLVSQAVLSGVELFWCRHIVDLRKVGRFFMIYLGNSLVMALFAFLCVRFIPGLWTSTIAAVCVGGTIYGLLLILEKNHFVMDFISLAKKKLHVRTN